MTKQLFILVVILLFSGCICCGGRDPSELISGLKSTGVAGGNQGAGADASGQGDVAENQCSSPYIPSGSECCLDRDDSGICDSEEMASSTAEGGDSSTKTTDTAAETTTSLTSTIDAGVESTQQAGQDGGQATTTVTAASQQTTTTVKVNAAVYGCVKNAGFDPNKVYYGYSPECGAKYKSDASMVSIRTGVDIQPVNIAVSTDSPVIKLLECFYGPYSVSNPEFGSCPRLLCPKTQDVKTLSGTSSASVSSQMSGFAKKCV
jgi:hypothetical protein